MSDVFIESHKSVIFGFKTQDCFRIHYIITVPFINCSNTKKVHSKCFQGSRLFQLIDIAFLVVLRSKDLITEAVS